MFKYYLKIGFLFFILILSVSNQTRIHAEDLAFFDQGFGDFSEELETAKEEGKSGVLIFYEMDECPFCHRMFTTLLHKP